jgi:excisionase family DNA binding protein
MVQVPSTAAPATLPPSETVSVEVAAARLGLSRTKAYALARQNALPVPALRLGRKVVIPVRALDRVLGVVEPVALENENTAPSESTPLAPASNAP